MVMKGSVLPDHVPVNNFELMVIGQPRIYFVEVSGIEEELEVVTLPDRTQASGGNTKPGEFTAMTMMHHDIERLALEFWYKEGQDPVSPLYKKPATLIHKRLSGTSTARFALVGLFISKRVLPDLDKNNEGEAAMIEWTFKFDDIIPLG